MRITKKDLRERKEGDIVGKFKSGGFAEYEIQNGIGKDKNMSNKTFVFIVIGLVIAIVIVLMFSIFTIMNEMSEKTATADEATTSETTVTYNPYDIFDFDNEDETAPAYAKPIIIQPSTQPTTQPTTQRTTQPATQRVVSNSSNVSSSSVISSNSNSGNGSNRNNNSNTNTNNSSSNRKPQVVVNSEAKQPQDSNKNINVTKVSLNCSSKNLYKGTSFKLTASVSPSNATDKKIYWTTSNKSVATVSGGTVKGLKEGTAVITARAGNKTASCTVTVTPKPTISEPEKPTVSIFPEERTMLVGSNATITLINNPYTSCKWTFSNPSVVELSKAETESKIVITAKKAGVTNVIATLKDGSQFKCKITVVE